MRHNVFTHEVILKCAITDVTQLINGHLRVSCATVYSDVKCFPFQGNREDRDPQEKDGRLIVSQMGYLNSEDVLG